MQKLRSRMTTMVLTIFVCLGLASTALAHHVPTLAEQRVEQAIQSLQAAGLPLTGICGETQAKRVCADDACPICRGDFAAAHFGYTRALPVLLAQCDALVMPCGKQPSGLRLLSAQDARGPPVVMI